MGTLNTIELKAFVPAKDFELSKQFYHDLGFTMPWSDKSLAYMHHGNTSFFLQNFYVKELADNFMMHLLVEDVDAWWANVQEKQIAPKYGVSILPPEQRPWKMRDFVLIDPSGVLWRIAENTP
jgi:predicted lactoylglutathione lyase